MHRWLILLSALTAAPEPLVAQTLASRPVALLERGGLQNPALRESSGLARSHLLPGVLFTINDSGNPPEIFAIDSSGRSLGRWRVRGAANRDWEAITSGGCPEGWCLYVADIGDNRERRAEVVIYRLPEPERLATAEAAGQLDSVVVRYPDGAHDAEAIWVDSTSLYLITKGRSNGIRSYRVPLGGFDAGGVSMAAQVQVLPIDPDQRLGRWVTDAALSPDGTTVAVRTYTELYLFPALSGGRLGTPVSCNLAGLEPQGEGVAWLDDRRLVLASEAFGATPGTVLVVSCGR